MSAKQQKWELAIAQVDKMIGDSNASLYGRVVLLMSVWENVDFLAFHKGSVDDAEAFLDSKLGDYGITFFNARDMLKTFPERTAWEKGRIRELLARTLQANEDSRKENAAPRVVKNPPIARKEHERVQEELRRTKIELTSVTTRKDTLIQENERLRSDNLDLRKENESLKAKLEELESSMATSRELAAA